MRVESLDNFELVELYKYLVRNVGGDHPVTLTVQEEIFTRLEVMGR